ncbi:MAG: hypothetical protein L0Y71_08000 [Gemmataceae bacterium]|nr:hypothetical protein [Gemmataceae bacterium]
MRRFAFDTVLVALNATDVHRLPFISTVLAEAARRNLGVIAMKTLAGGRMPGTLSVGDALGYVWSLPGVSLAIVGCSSPEEVDENARAAREFATLTDVPMRDLEDRTRGQASSLGYFKRD